MKHFLSSKSIKGYFYIYNSNPMINCITIDDESKAHDSFKKLVDRYLIDQVRILASCDSVKSGVEAINKYHPDIVFLDVEMPEENGFKLFNYFNKIDFEVVFTTAYNKYAIDAFKFSALDYLLKPINYIELRDVLNKYAHKRDLKTQQEKIDTLLSNLNMGNLLKSKVALPTQHGYQMEKINNIVYCEADQNYTKIHLVTGKHILVSKTLKLVEELLPDICFFRIHKSFLINLNYVDRYSRTDGHRVLMEDGTQLDVANRRTEDFIKAITAKNFTQS